MVRIAARQVPPCHKVVPILPIAPCTLGMGFAYLVLFSFSRMVSTGHLDLITLGTLCMDMEPLHGTHSVYQTDLEPPYTRIVHYLGVSYTTDIGGLGSVLVPIP